ncbi:MAG: peptide chain release factor-like protein [candidate division KSB1 bacterium]|nr:peptide chain release factor-like protein [candidate division KSB1 bacterium]MDZ7305207.1 peptide chain release factor-like protein [candidate division KSB1 bacterium]MDZ7314318.1 peptide chain release factor-like protein [candidate division KSB1 bacterium]
MNTKQEKEADEDPRIPLTISALQDEVEITTFKSGGPGGQHKNKTESAVRIKHLPTGVIVVATENRSQIKNRELAWQRLMEKLRKRRRKRKPRIPTRPSRAAKEKRFQEKLKLSVKKQTRQKIRLGDNH